MKGRNILYKYFAQLELLEVHFPLNDSGVRVAFTWLDAFSRKSVTQHSIVFEKACVIFCLGAVLSQIADNQNRLEADGLKVAYQSLQCAAGMFTHIHDNFLHAPSDDVSKNCVQTLSSLMLAQAQEVRDFCHSRLIAANSVFRQCFWEKAVMDRLKPSMVAKLASSVCRLYQTALDSATSKLPAGYLDPSWVTTMQVKVLHFGSIAQHYASLVAEQEQQVRSYFAW